MSGSTNMEKEGFIRGMKVFEEYDLLVELLVTDRHKQLAKWIRENLPDIKHRYDVWHVAKSMTFQPAIKFYHLCCIYRFQKKGGEAGKEKWM